MGDERATSTQRGVKLLSLIAVAVVAGCAHGGTAASAQASAAAVLANNPGSSSDGATVYATNCSDCHGADGRGIEGMIPPLARNADVTGDPQRVVARVEDGLQQRVVVNGVRYDGDMPAWKGAISGDEIASVVTYIRSAWGNRASGVTLAQVRNGGGTSR